MKLASSIVVAASALPFAQAVYSPPAPEQGQELMNLWVSIANEAKFMQQEITLGRSEAQCKEDCNTEKKASNGDFNRGRCQKNCEQIADNGNDRSGSSGCGTFKNGGRRSDRCKDANDAGRKKDGRKRNDDDDDDDDVTPASEDDIADGIDGDTYDGGAPVYRDCPNNLQSVHTAPLLAFGLAPTITDDIRQIETNNLQQSQDIEGLPLVPKRKRRRKRKRKRPRRRKGQANKPRPKHSPVTPPRRHTNVRRQAAKTHESLIKEFQAYFYSDAAKYCPASGFDTKWHRKGIG
mmetsp:Transcript_36013/g.85848  ORF Transcript_36013/g.85848 Transcript_36013/m.85848 type:complete len:292 (+) Transcript_36013:150-1025(+)